MLMNGDTWNSLSNLFDGPRLKKKKMVVWFWFWFWFFILFYEWLFRVDFNCFDLNSISILIVSFFILIVIFHVGFDFIGLLRRWFILLFVVFLLNVIIFLCWSMVIRLTAMHDTSTTLPPPPPLLCIPVGSAATNSAPLEYTTLFDNARAVWLREKKIPNRFLYFQTEWYVLSCGPWSLVHIYIEAFMGAIDQGCLVFHEVNIIVPLPLLHTRPGLWQVLTGRWYELLLQVPIKSW